MFSMLAEAVEDLAVPVDGRAIAAAIALRDRVDAKIAAANAWWPPATTTHG